MNPRHEAINDINQSQNVTLTSNPMAHQAKKISSGLKKTSNKLYGSYNSNGFSSLNEDNIDSLTFLSEFCDCARQKASVDDIFFCLQNTIATKLGLNFIAMGLIKHDLHSVDIKLTDRINNTYSLKVLMSDETNPLIESISDKKSKVVDNVDFLNIHHLKSTSAMIFPLISHSGCIGVMTVGSNNLSSQKIQLLKLVSEYTALYLQNLNLNLIANQKAHQDSLTGLKNHRGFQDTLREQIKKAKKASQPLSVILFDINNISKINRELGYAKGDEVIKIVANKIKENTRPIDISARYGGDEIVLLLPNTDNSEACYMAEYLNYIISCSKIDDIGGIKMSIGLATYPNCSVNQEKLLLLAEQAVTISKHKGYKNGLSTIISSQDVNFWDGTALASFASVISKRHSELGINFENELITQFKTEKIESNAHLAEMATSLAGAIDAKDPYTNGHSQSVSRYSEALAVELNLPKSEVARIKMGALLHDIGKIGVPERILKKPGALTDEEWNIMKQHPSIGVKKVLGSIDSLKDLIPIVEHHHENWDGTGYPAKLAGEDIPLGARIVAVADAFHALISDRPYRKGLSIDKAIEILKAGAGIQWDKNLVRKFVMIAPSLSTTI